MAVTLPFGRYFRATDNQVDPANYDVEISEDVNYSGANGFGWEAEGAGGLNSRNRDTTTDVRLKGLIFHPNDGTVSDYRIDLPATGDYLIRGAFGDGSSQQLNAQIRFYDDATLFATPVGNATLNAGEWTDATGVVRTSEADWVNNNATLARTFTSTIFRIRIGGVNGTNGSPIAAIYIESAGGGATTRRYTLSTLGVG